MWLVTILASRAGPVRAPHRILLPFWVKDLLVDCLLLQLLSGPIRDDHC